MLDYLFIVYYLLILTVPGIVISRVIYPKLEISPLSSMATSYLIVTIIVVVGNHFAFRSTTVGYTLLLLTLACTICLFFLKNKHSTNVWLAPILTIGLASLIYQIIFGSYSEVPADAYAHLERIQSAIKQVENGNLGIAIPWSKVFRQGIGTYYYFVALAAFPFDIPTYQLFEILDFLNRTLFLVAVFFFTKVVFKEHKNKTALAYLATIFVVLHFGINVFSYVRYYSVAPSILAFTLYFYAVALYLETVTKKQPYLKISISALIVLSLILAAAVIHVQEAMFISVMVVLIAFVATLSRFTPITSLSKPQFFLSFAISIAAITVFAYAYIYSQQHFERAPNAHWRLWDFGVGQWIFPQLTILNLKFQFIRVATLWGVLVYLLFFINIKRYKGNYFILAGMFSPLFTFLNPFFVDLFLRHNGSTTVWRLCYLIPFHLVAADLFIFYVKQIKASKLILVKTLSLCIVALLILLLTPLKNTWNNVHYSRFPTLNDTQEGVGYQHYIDLIKYLDSIDSRKLILTDPMTGYMISALTKHYSPRRKFFRERQYNHFTFPTYDNNPIDKHENKLIVINKREKAKSKIAKLSGHWREVEWIDKNRYYPDDLLEHLNSRPQKFNKLWSSEDNSVMVFHIL